MDEQTRASLYRKQAALGYDAERSKMSTEEIVQQRTRNLEVMDSRLRQLEAKLGFDGGWTKQPRVRAYSGSTSYNAFQGPTIRAIIY